MHVEIISYTIFITKNIRFTIAYCLLVMQHVSLHPDGANHKMDFRNF